MQDPFELIHAFPFGHVWLCGRSGCGDQPFGGPCVACSRLDHPIALAVTSFRDTSSELDIFCQVPYFQYVLEVLA